MTIETEAILLRKIAPILSYRLGKPPRSISSLMEALLSVKLNRHVGESDQLAVPKDIAE